ncbi:hypothetical protein K491DRAFT_685213 [Lophiostoma macrostomum CBS 122681]|uniref:Uncharacterized protein n=1 Tax=Lophiostoma macrostomum CBS 122681 TaxID=1314788 RepID=A0A6A6SJQ4_9PLEO|nr:hypothetical protein K491DRAFT_685213 [Lophiostoma macrostomum CBS 122681]
MTLAPFSTPPQQRIPPNPLGGTCNGLHASTNRANQPVENPWRLGVEQSGGRPGNKRLCWWHCVIAPRLTVGVEQLESPANALTRFVHGKKRAAMLFPFQTGALAAVCQVDAGGCMRVDEGETMGVRLCAEVLLVRIIKRCAVERIAEAFFEGGDCPLHSLVLDVQAAQKGSLRTPTNDETRPAQPADRLKDLGRITSAQENAADMANFLQHPHGRIGLSREVFAFQSIAGLLHIGVLCPVLETAPGVPIDSQCDTARRQPSPDGMHLFLDVNCPRTPSPASQGGETHRSAYYLAHSDLPRQYPAGSCVLSSVIP